MNKKSQKNESVAPGALSPDVDAQLQSILGKTDSVQAAAQDVVATVPEELQHCGLVAIVGRPNVGKSTLFNRLVGERRAVVHHLPGMTRDRHYADAEYRMRPFTLIDTGGYEDSVDSTILQQMRQQSIIAIEEADVVIFLADLQQPNNPIDHEILTRLRAGGKPFFLVINKCEGKYGEAQAYADFSIHGLDTIYPISALHGEGVYDLMDDVTEWFQSWDTDDDENDGVPRVAIVGRQNVGKSTLLNNLFGQERVIANPIGGTTRDAIDCEIQVDGEKYIVIDTAGIRRRGKIERGPEALSVHSSFRAIDRADVVLLVLDTSEGITLQDQHIAGYVLERNKACIILLNKWDAVPNREAAFGELIRNVRNEFVFMRWAPIMTISARTGQRTHKIWEMIRHCMTNYRRTFKTRELNLILRQATAYVSPPTARGSQLHINYVTQTGVCPPKLTLFVNDPRLLHFSYFRFLRNQYYAALGLEGTPLVMRFRRKAPPRGWERVVRTMTSGFIPSEHGPVREDDDDFQGAALEEMGEGYRSGASKLDRIDDEQLQNYYEVDEDDGDDDFVEYSTFDDDDRED